MEKTRILMALASVAVFVLLLNQSACGPGFCSLNGCAVVLTCAQRRVGATDRVGEDEHLIFVLENTHDGNFAVEDPVTNDGLTGADNLCQADANAAGLSRCYKAVLSTGLVDARNRITINGTIRGPSGGSSTYLVDDNGNDFFAEGSLNSGISTAADGSANANAWWSGTDTDGTAGGSTCSAWTNTSSTGSFAGATGVNAGQWLASGAAVNCSNPARLLCISQ